MTEAIKVGDDAYTNLREWVMRDAPTLCRGMSLPCPLTGLYPMSMIGSWCGVPMDT